MVKQAYSMSVRRLAYIAFALIVMMMSWESTKMQASALIQQDIPKDSIRIRILANSDSVADQWVKREVRDAIFAEIRTWAEGPQTIEQAREMIRARLGELEQLSNDTLHDRGFGYDAKVELDTVPFPAKTVGTKVYPAGQYEALRVTLGKGEGQNWWCVLFPPLCFMGGQIVAKKDVEAKQAAEREEPAAGQAGQNARGTASAAGNQGQGADSGKAPGKAASGKNATEKASGGGKVGSGENIAASAKESGAKGKTASDTSQTVKASQPQPEIHFFVWDMLKKLFA
ncbi:stage II sporulation protein R [Paenibacillus hamazuiensis]|uniref:stage II sporulation protein R n=1 Tax=Paenibacillus hamazuiensis TaxID=2936508 RepID=UPI00200D3279|nr:stage II sporulation protein R [Paenibacillus hamazuiensis]